MNYDNDEMYEVSDYDEDIKRREALIEEVKAIEASSDWSAINRAISDVRRKWKQISYWDSAFEDTLTEQFDGYIDALYAIRKEGYQSNQAIKQELIDRAKKVATSNEWNQATDEMNELMAQWKACGSVGKEADDAMWESFNEARQAFFDRKRDHWENLQEKFGTARQVKEALIQKAADLADSEEWQKSGEQFRTLMEEWKAVGSAGKEHEDRLWNAFNEHRQKFYGKREDYYTQVRGEQGERYTAKEALVAIAKSIAESKEYTKENTEKLKSLQVEWKKIGSCGKDREDQIWNEFRAILDGYFGGLKQMNEQKHAQWRQRMLEARSRKLELLQKQKRQVKYMEEEIVGLLGQRAIDEMEDSIAEKEEFIEQLEAELADIDKTLQQ